MKTLGRYEIRRELGKGAMGVVYEAFDTLIQRTVALKTVLPEYMHAPGMEDALARFQREAQAAGRLNHPGVVAVYDFGEEIPVDDKGQPGPEKIKYIAMEFVKGRELRSFFDANQRFNVPDIVRIMGEILDALGHAHANGVVHRDMKPANLFVLENGKVKIGDFGIARVESSDLTQVGTVMGTPSYMSPEQITGQPVDGRSDIFSCGVILYQLLTGEKPFTGNQTTIMYKVMNENPLPPSMLNVALPPAFDAVVKKAMSKSPEQRYQNAAQFAQAIVAAQQAPQDDDRTLVRPVAPVDNNVDKFSLDPTTVHIPRPPAPAVEATTLNPATRTQAPPPPAPQVHQTSTSPAPAPIPTPTPQAGPAKNKVALLATVAGGILVVGAGAYFALRSSAEKPVPPQSGNNPPLVIASPTPVTAPQPANETPTEAGSIVISAVGLVDPKDPRFNGDSAAAQAEVRADARRQLVEKAVALYVDRASLDKNYALIEQKLLSKHGDFIKNVIHEGAAETGKNGLLSSETRAVLKVRELRKSLNELSKAERIDFIRNNGDPKISIQMTIANADNAQTLPAARSQLAENVLKERIKSFGFRVWANDGEVKSGNNAKSADFHIIGEAKFKQLSAKLPASGLTITKTVLTSWTVKAVDKASNEEIYLNTVLPKGQSWASEDQALSDIGKQMGDEFSKDFFMQHFDYGVKKANLNIQGLPDAQIANLLLGELRSVRQILDAQMGSGLGRYQLEVPEASNSELLQDWFIHPLNAKMGQACFALAGSNAQEINISFAPQCKDAGIRAKLENGAPAGLLHAPGERGKQLLKSSGKIST